MNGYRCGCDEPGTCVLCTPVALGGAAELANSPVRHVVDVLVLEGLVSRFRGRVSLGGEEAAEMLIYAIEEAIRAAETAQESA